jgi:N-acetylglutamate synthase-like GNAT family acetyltransferase
MIQVRKVEPQDLQYLYQNAEELGFMKDDMAERLEHMMVVLEGKEICGMGFCKKEEEQCLLNWIYIKEAHRRNSLGTMLVKTMLSNSEQQGAILAYLQCGTLDFAEFLGFQEITEAKELAQTQGLYQSRFGRAPSEKLYKVSLLGYFKPCGRK